MQKLIIFIIGAFGISTACFGQQCGTKAQEADSLYTIHYGRSDLLTEVNELIQTHIAKSPKSPKTTQTQIDNSMLFNIPMKVWVYNRQAPATPLPAMNDTEIENTLLDLNLIFEPAGIRFYLKCEIEQVFDDRFWSISSAEEDQRMKNTYHDEWALNMHVIGSGDTGRGEFPWNNPNASFSIASSNIYHIAHEIGHALGLYHTFESRRGGTDNGSEGNCYQEAVSRSKKQGLFCISTAFKKKCEVNGDGFCDTDADYKTSDDFRTGSCGYTGTKRDNWGDQFKPPTNNIMSYWWHCRNSFTPNQLTTMVIYLGVYSPFFGNYFTHDGISFLNLNSINITGDVFNGETEEFIVPEEIVNNDDLLVHAGGKLNLQAQEQIILRTGFHAQNSSNFRAHIGQITNCDNTYKPGSNSSKRISLPSYQNEFQEELALLIDKHLTQESIDQPRLDSNATDTNEQISVYPTLLEDNKTIHIAYNFSSDEYFREISIYTMNGIKLSSFTKDDFTVSGTVDLQLPDIYQSGHYIIKLVTNKRIQTSRFAVINK